MFKQLTITDIKQTVKNISQNKIYKTAYWIISDILNFTVLSIKTALVISGMVFIAFILIFRFNPGLMESVITNGDAVVFYRNNLPAHLTKKETGQVTELNSLIVKLNRESNSAISAAKIKKEIITLNIPPKTKK
ncbi:MAG: hypothetical protein ACYCT6_08970 [bacterium]